MTTPTPQELLALAEKAEQIYKGFELESLNGVVCSIPNEGLETEPHRTWCRNCQKRYRELKALSGTLRALAAAPSASRRVVEEQAEDDGLWFDAATAPEAYLQAALRRLHAAVEGDLVAAPSAGPEEETMRVCFVGTCGKPDVNAPDEGTWPTCSKYPPACAEHMFLVPPKQQRPLAAPSAGAGAQDAELRDAVCDAYRDLKDLYHALMFDAATAPESMVREVARIARDTLDKNLNILHPPFRAWCDEQWTQMPPPPPPDTLDREALVKQIENDVPRYRMTGRYGGEVRCEIIDTIGVGEWVRIADVLTCLRAPTPTGETR